MKAATEIKIDLDEDERRQPETDIVEEDAKVPASAAIDGDIVDEDFDPSDRLPPQAVRNADHTVTLPLAYPQTITSRKDGKIRERKFDQLVFHRLNGADQRAIQAASEEMTAVVAIGQSTKINQAIMNRLFDKMDASDLNAAGQVLNHFLASGRKAGK